MASFAARRLVLRTLLSLPSPVLRTLSGGGVVHQGGRTLDPRLQFLAAASRVAAPLAAQTPEEARRASREALAALSGPREPEVDVSPLQIPGPSQPIPARVYRPRTQAPAAAVLVYAHAGGGVLGGLESCDAYCSVIAQIARCAVVSVDYRLAPEHRFPAGLNDMAAAFLWVRAKSRQFGAAEGRAAIGGEAMGASFAAAVCLMLKASGEPQPDLQLLICPCLDAAGDSASMTTYADAFPLSRDLLDWLMSHYLGPDADPADPRLSPLRAASLQGLAPAVVVTAGFDPLLDQGEAYARRLKESGTPGLYRCYDSLAHGFTAFSGVVPCADVAGREIAGLVREGLEGRIV